MSLTPINTNSEGNRRDDFDLFIQFFPTIEKWDCFYCKSGRNQDKGFVERSLFDEVCKIHPCPLAVCQIYDKHDRRPRRSCLQCAIRQYTTALMAGMRVGGCSGGNADFWGFELHLDLDSRLLPRFFNESPTTGSDE